MNNALIPSGVTGGSDLGTYLRQPRAIRISRCCVGKKELAERKRWEKGAPWLTSTEINTAKNEIRKQIAQN